LLSIDLLDVEYEDDHQDCEPDDIELHPRSWFFVLECLQNFTSKDDLGIYLPCNLL
jgi:hypothetical protein